MMNLRLPCAALLLMVPISAHADEVGEIQKKALDVCLLENSTNPQPCHKVVYYTCMGSDLKLAGNIDQSRERCLGQELVAWKKMIKDTCLERAKIDDDPDKYKKEICLKEKSPWGDDLPITTTLKFDSGYDDPNHQKIASEARLFFMNYLMIFVEYNQKLSKKK